MKSKKAAIWLSLLLIAGAVGLYLHAYASTNQCLYGL